MTPVRKRKNTPLMSVTPPNFREGEAEIQEDRDLSKVIELLSGRIGAGPQVLDSKLCSFVHNLLIF